MILKAELLQLDRKGRKQAMKNLTLRKIAEICKGTLHREGENADVEVSGVVLDSRQIEKGYLFIATRGEHVDGHRFIPQVFAKGAAGVVCEEEPEGRPGPYILVEDSFQALKDIAGFYRQQLDITVVGITGSVGKTSTKEFVASVLETKYKVLKTEGNFNNEIGLPLTILHIRDCHEVAVVEMGISDFGEMHRLSEIARPDICVLTNIGQCHLENLKSREGILKAKTEIFDFMGEKGKVCINGDDDMLRTVKRVRGEEPLTFGMERGNDVYADNVENKGLFGISADIHMDGEVFRGNIPLPGEHMVYNALAAACVGRLMGLTGEEIARGLETVKPVDGRSHIMRLEDKVIIDDCYNANPVSMCAAVDLLSMALARKVAVLGDMFELGKEEKALHRKVGAYAAIRGIDVIICIGELSRSTYAGACEGYGLEGKNCLVPEKSRSTSFQDEKSGRSVYYFSGKEEFLKSWRKIIRKDDRVLVKASHGMAFEQIVKALAEA